jgi:hypothetical protein
MPLMILVLVENLAPNGEWVARAVGAAFIGRHAAIESRRVLIDEHWRRGTSASGATPVVKLSVRGLPPSANSGRRVKR